MNKRFPVLQKKKIIRFTGIVSGEKGIPLQPSYRADVQFQKCKGDVIVTPGPSSDRLAFLNWNTGQ